MTEVDMSMFDALRLFKQSLDTLLNGENVATDPDAVRKWAFVLMVFPYNDRSGGCSVVSNGVSKHDIMGIFQRQLEAYDKEQQMADRREEHEPFDPAANMPKINAVMHELRDGLITREVAKQRLIDECHVADYNLDTLLNVYDPNAKGMDLDDE